MAFSAHAAGAQLKYPPGSQLCTFNPRELVAILKSDEGLEAEEPLTVHKVFQSALTNCPQRAALCYKEDDESDWKRISYSDYYMLSVQAAKSLIKLGVEPFSVVALMGFVSPECIFSYFGTVFAGGIFIGLRADETPEGITYQLNFTKAEVIVVEGAHQVETILQIRDKLTCLKAIVQYSGVLVQSFNGLYSWKDFLALGQDVEDSVVKERMKQQTAPNCVTMVFSSGTTGNCKCAMMSHDNLMWSVKMLHAALAEGLGFGVDNFITYNEAYFISCFNLDIFLAVYCAATLHIAPPSARYNTREYLSTVRKACPTLFFGPCSMWEDIRHILLVEGEITAESARDFLGLRRCKILLTAGVAVPVELLEFFESINMPLIEAYGMTENSGGITVNSLQGAKLGSVGKPYPGTYVKIDNPDENGDGEILVFGRQRFMGYLYDEEETKKAVDHNGWLHTGDIGHIDSDGFLFFTGRKKEMIVLSDGNNVAPVHIEAMIKKEAPFLSNVVLVGDGRDYLCCLMTLKTMMDAQTGEPLDQLTPSALTHVVQLGSQCDRASQVVRQKDETVYRAIQRSIDLANNRAYNVQDRVIKFMLLEKDFSIFGGEIGKTLKLKRNVVKDKYFKQISDMYENIES